jgi:hypothetical protein
MLDYLTSTMLKHLLTITTSIKLVQIPIFYYIIK